MKRKIEMLGSAGGLLGGAAIGAKIGASIGLATGGVAIAGTVPFGIIGGLLLGFIGNKIGTESDHHRTLKQNENRNVGNEKS